MLLLVWLVCLVLWRPDILGPLEQLAGMRVHLAGLRLGPVPDVFRVQPTGLLALAAALAVWIGGNWWILRRREI